MVWLKILWADYRLMRDYRNGRWRSLVKAVLITGGYQVWASPRRPLVYDGPDYWTLVRK